MKYKLKRILSVLLCLVMVLGLLPTAAFAAESGETTGRGTKNDPYLVSTYSEMKRLLESDGETYIKVIAMDNNTRVDGVGPARLLYAGTDYEIEGAAINIRTGAKKHLEIATDIYFIAEASTDGTKIFGRLIDVNTESTLDITGDGSIRVEFNTAVASNAILDVWGGTVNIDGDVTFDTRQDFTNNIAGHPILINGGVTNINNGKFYGYDSWSSGGWTCAIPFGNVLGKGTKLNITGGYFEESTKYDSEESYVFCLKSEKEEVICLSGGTFEGGIMMKTGNPLSNLLETGYQFYDMSNNTFFNGSVSSTTSKLTVIPAGVQNPTLTPQGGEAISSSGKATITPGTNTFTISATTSDWLKELVRAGSAEYTVQTLIYKGDQMLIENSGYVTKVSVDGENNPIATIELNNNPEAGENYSVIAMICPEEKATGTNLCDLVYGSWTLKVANLTAISNAPIKMSAALMPGSSAPTAAAYSNSNPYRVESTTWYSDESCTTGNEVTSFDAGNTYYAKIVLKPSSGYKFADTAWASVWCDDFNASYSHKSLTVAEGGSSLSVVVQATAQAALKWQEYPAGERTCTLSADSGYGSLMLTAWAAGGDTSKPISYRLYVQKGSDTAVIKAAASVSTDDKFNAVCNFGKDDTGTYTCWFEATRGDVTIKSGEFTVIVSYPGLSITNQSGDMTVKQNGTARLFVIANGVGPRYQWQVKNGDIWTDVSGETDYDFAAPTDTDGATIYRCKITDRGGNEVYSNEMTVTVTKDDQLAPAFPIAGVNEQAIDLETQYADHIIPAYSGIRHITYPETVEKGQAIELHATYVLVPNGYYYSTEKKAAKEDYYYDSRYNKQYTAVAGTVTSEWAGTEKDLAWAEGKDFTKLADGTDTTITIPESLTGEKYYVKLTVTNTVDDSTYYQDSFSGTVYITFNVSPEHEHDYTDHYAQPDDTQHTAYCACGDSTPENHDASGMDGACSKCGYTPAKTYSITVTGGTANPTVAVAGTTITLTYNTPDAGYEFDQWAGNVNVNTGSDGSYTFTMPSHDVELSAVYKAAATEHTHSYGNWTNINDDKGHIKSCSNPGCDQPVLFEAHSFGNWTPDPSSPGQHYRVCSDCGHKVYAAHYEGSRITDTAAGIGTPGAWHTECVDCGKKMDSGILDALTKIDVANLTVAKPVKGEACAEASTTDTTYYVAYTEWMDQNGDPLTIGDTFKAGTVYTAKITLEGKDNNVFSANSSYNTIEGKTATVSPALTGDAYAYSVVLTYTFDKTEEEMIPMPTEYNIMVTSGTASVGSGTAITKAASGTVVTITAEAAADGKVFDKWVVDSGTVTISNKTSETATFTMPEVDVQITATYKDAGTTPAHVHNLVYKDAKEATCTEAGYKGHYQCTDCSIIFEDKLGKIELKPSEIVIPAAGHVWNSAYSYDADSHWTSCTVCGEVSEKTAHTFNGSTCLICGYQKNTSSGSDSSYDSNSNSSSDSDSGSSYTSSTRTRKAVTGTWIQDEKGWWYKSSNGTYPRNGWAKLPWQGIEYWYYFDADGYMKMGWLESSGSYYYLNPIVGTNSGKMLTGWQLIDHKWYYFSTEQGAKEGSLLRNTVTPDHYQVDQDGVWKQ